MALTVAAFALVAVSVWWYFSDEARWESKPSERAYLGSSMQDSSQRGPATPAGQNPPANRTQASVPAPKSDTSIAPSLIIDHPVRLELRNGCYQKGLAQQVASALRARSTFFDVRGMVNSRGDTVEFSSVIGRTSDPSLATAVADSLGINRSRVTMDIPKFPRDVDVTVVLGKDYPRLHLNLKTDSKE